MRVLGVLSSAVLATLALSVPAAEAASWSGRSNSGSAYETCTDSRKHKKVTYSTCIQHSAGHKKVRVVMRVSLSAKRKVSGFVSLNVPGKSHNFSSRTCTATLSKGSKKQCATAWLNANRIVQQGEATIRISGDRRPDMRLRGMRLSGKKQENSAKYCGPATVQAALRTMKGSSPSQDTLANRDNLKTNQLGFTAPTRLDNVLNKYKPPRVSKYAVYDFGPSGQSSELGFRQIHRSIAAGQPVVYLVDPSKLPWSSNPAGTNVRHYILLHGYAARETSGDHNLNGGWFVDNYSAWDPADGKRHRIDPGQLLHASTASQYIDDDMVFAAK